MLGYIGIQLGRNWNNMGRYSMYLDVVGIIALGGLVIWFIYNRRKAKGIRT
jgi:membrane protein DedA with SNARE-associated domain